MKVPFLDLKRQLSGVKDELEKGVLEVLESGGFILGEKVARLEEEMKKLTGAEHAVAVGSGTDALYIALRAFGVGEGDEVITTPFTFFASASAIARTGARPVFADIDAETLNIDPESVKERLSEKTRGIIPVHLFGYSAPMDELLEIAKDKGLFVLEDAAQAIGTLYKGIPAGSIGDAAIFSFYPTKNLGASGDAGMITAASVDVADKCRLLRNHGSKDAVTYGELGICSRMDAFQAASLLAKLPRLEEYNEGRRRVAAAYNKAFADLPVSTPTLGDAGTTHIFHHYTLRLDDRDALQEHLNGKEIGNGIYYRKPLNMQPCFEKFEPKACPVAEREAGRVLQLPVFPELTQEETGAVIDAVKGFFK